MGGLYLRAHPDPNDWDLGECEDDEVHLSMIVGGNVSANFDYELHELNPEIPLTVELETRNRFSRYIQTEAQETG